MFIALACPSVHINPYTGARAHILLYNVHTGGREVGGRQTSDVEQQLTDQMQIVVKALNDGFPGTNLTVPRAVEMLQTLRRSDSKIDSVRATIPPSPQRSLSFKF